MHIKEKMKEYVIPAITMLYASKSRNDGANMGWENGMAKIMAFKENGREANPLNIIRNIGIIANAEIGRVKVWADL